MFVKGLFGKTGLGSKDDQIHSDILVRLMEPIAHAPVSPAERLIVARLRREGTLPFNVLAQQVARDLLSEELRNGGWVLDVGLFGSKLFVPDVVASIQDGDGILWHIEKAAT